MESDTEELVLSASDGREALLQGLSAYDATDGDLTDIYYYTDGVFSGLSTEYNEHLATMSMILAAASISSQEPDATYDIKSQNLIDCKA